MRVFVPAGVDAPGCEPVTRTMGPVPAGLPAGAVVLLEQPAGAPAFAVRCREQGLDPWVLVQRPDEVAALIELGVGLWLRGSEAGGPVQGFTGLVLLRAAVNVGPVSPASFVLDGLGTRAMAASIAVGAAGVVLDAHLWGVPQLAPEPLRAHLGAALSGRDTMLEGELEGTHRRRLNRGPAGQRPDAPQNIGEAHRYAAPTAAEVVRRVRDAIASHLALIPSHHPLRPGVDPLGTGTPIVQGPMANVAESAGLASAVRAAGGLPFAALGALRPDAAAAVLHDMANVPRPWGVGIIGFDVMPFRDAHLDLVGEFRPDAVIIAGGSPQLAVRLQDEGLHPWLHTPSPRLARMALERGVRAIVFEGNEAGGHVGALTSIGLWEEGLAAAEAHGDGLIVLAGGIGDPISAAFAAAMATPAAARGCRIALQAGTAFFFTHDILESGQITPAYQRAALAARETVLVGSTVNLPLRCAPNDFTAAARGLEAAWHQEGLATNERRQRMEHHNLGRTRVAAKGIERNPTWDGRDPSQRYRPVPPARTFSDGAFTMGQGAAVHDRVTTVRDVVDALSAQAAALLDAPHRAANPSPWASVTPVPGKPAPEAAPVAKPVSLRARTGTGTATGTGTGTGDIAIVGMGTIVPGAGDLAAFWRNLVDGVDATGEIPPDRWKPDTYWRQGDATPGSSFTYSKVAGAVRDFEFDPLKFRIPPRVAPTLDPSQRLALTAADEAIRVAGWHTGKVDGQRAAVVMGNAMGGEFAKGLALRIRFREVLDALHHEGAFDGMSAADRAELSERVEARLSDDLPPIDVDTMAGLLSNVIAGRVASWLDWMGGNMTVDAACAASLAATSVAVDWLRAGRCDVVLTGGVDTDLSPETYVGFCRTSALSSAGSRPFSADADGFVMGEGCAVLALKRLDDAIADGDPVWAVIRGVGQSSDGRGRGITAPRAEGQKLALQRAYADAGVDPASVGMIEAHGTGTALGDVTETGVLADWFADRKGHAWLGSVKSMIGHLKGAAGAAGLVKATLSVATGVVPPTLHAGPVNPRLDLGNSPLRLPRYPARFPGTGPRRAGVSAFGFGGTNFHVVLEQAPSQAVRPPQLDALVAYAEPRVAADAAWPLHQDPPIHAWGAPTFEALVQAVRSRPPQPPAQVAAQPHRAALTGSTDELAAHRQRLAAWLPSVRDKTHAVLGAQAAYGHGEGQPVVLLAPGQGSQKPGSVASVRRWPAGAGVLSRIESHLGHDLDRLEAEGAATRALHPLLFGVSTAWAAVAHAAGLPVAGALGHSLGEYAALAATDALSPEQGLDLVQARGQALASCARGSMLAVDLPQDEARLLAQQSGLALAAVNDPTSAVLSGPSEAVAALRAELKLRGLRCTILAVEHAFHSPSIQPAATALRAALAQADIDSGTAPVWSAATAEVMHDPAADLTAALTQPVRFADAVAAVPSDAIFVELGPGRVLSRRVQRCRPGATAIALDPSPGDAGRGTCAAAVALLAAGHPGLAEQLAATPTEPTQVAAPPAAPNADAPPSPTPPRPSQPAPALQSEARRVQDLRIAALADPAHQPAYQAARKLLLDRLAALDAGAEPAPTPVAHVPASPAVPAASEPAPASVPASDTRAAVVAAIVEVTGYPADFLTDDADLEAELGVDSIRKMEILGMLQDQLGFTTHESDYAELANLNITGLVQHIEARLPDGVPLATPEPSPEPQPVRALLYTYAATGSAPPPGDTAAELRALLAHLRAHPGPLPAPTSPATAAFGRCIAREQGHALPTTSVPIPLDPLSAELPAQPFVVATGGATGIVARCLQSLADLGPRVLLLGRRPESEVADALTQLRRTGVATRYASVDVTDAAAVATAIEQARADWGPVQLVVHGAGVLRDNLLGNIDPDDISAVLDPKLAGATALFGATRGDQPALYVSFSSIVVERGNPGQSLYAAANAALEQLDHPTAARSLHLRWTAWSEVGMASNPALQRVLAQRGLRSLDPDTGAAAFRRALGSRGVVAITAQDAPPALPWPLGPATELLPGISARFRVPLDPTHAALDHHRVGGRPLVPGAVWAVAMQTAARVLDRREGSWSLADFRIVAPTFVERPRADVVVELVRDSEVWRARVLARDAVVAQATLSIRSTPAAMAAPRPLAGEAAGPLYRHDLLFHGPAWQMLDRLESDGNGGLSADLLPADTVDPLASAIDGVHQALSAWSGARTGWLGLPVGAGRWTFGEGVPQGPLRLQGRARPADGGIEAEVTVLDAAGRVVLRGEGVQLRQASRWPADAPDPLGAGDA